MSINDLAEMIRISIGISIAFGCLIGFYFYCKLDKIYDELKEIRKEKKEIKHGHWVTVCDGLDMIDYCTCSLCDHKTYEHYPNFCPYCGADMKGETNG